MIFIAIFAGFGLLYFILKLPQWISNKTGKTVKIKSSVSTIATYQPQNKHKRELEILEHPMLMSLEHEIEYIEKGNKRVLIEYVKLPLLDRERIKAAIKLYPENNVHLDDSSDYYPIYLKEKESKLRYWYSNNSMLNYNLTKVDFKSFDTLSSNEKQMIESFINMCTNASKAWD